MYKDAFCLLLWNRAVEGLHVLVNFLSLYTWMIFLDTLQIPMSRIVNTHYYRISTLGGGGGVSTWHSVQYPTVLMVWYSDTPTPRKSFSIRAILGLRNLI